jgi:hypothetical protein
MAPNRRRRYYTATKHIVELLTKKMVSTANPRNERVCIEAFSIVGKPAITRLG